MNSITTCFRGRKIWSFFGLLTQLLSSIKSGALLSEFGQLLNVGVYAYMYKFKQQYFIFIICQIERTSGVTCYWGLNLFTYLIWIGEFQFVFYNWNFFSWEAKYQGNCDHFMIWGSGNSPIVFIYKLGSFELMNGFWKNIWKLKEKQNILFFWAFQVSTLSYQVQLVIAILLLVLL